MLSAALMASQPSIVSAAPGDLSSAVAKYPILNGTMLQNCTLCHTASIPSLNPFGAAYKSAGRNTAAFAAIENLDSDGDGVSNIKEINALTFPGDASSHPAIPTATSIPPTATPVPPTVTAAPPTATGIAPKPTATGLPPQPTATAVTPIPSGQLSVKFTCPASALIGSTFTCTLSVNPAGAALAGLQVNLSGLGSLAQYTGTQFTSLAGPSPISLNIGNIFTWAGSNGYLLNQAGDLATLSFKALASGPVTIGGQAKAANAANAQLSVSTATALVTITSSTQPSNGKVSGTADLSSKTSPTRASAALLNSAGQVVVSESLEDNGAYELEAPAGTYTLRISAPGFLAARKSVTLAGTTLVVAKVTLLAGDINGDNSIDALDLISLGAAFEIPPALAAADFNADGKVDLFDLTLLAPNWRKTGYTGW
jgi:hypothetical protein